MKAKVVCEVCGLDKEYKLESDAYFIGLAHKRGQHNVR